MSEPAAVLRTWARHYQELAADATGHSRDHDFWRRRFEGVPVCEPLPGMDDAVTWGELNNVLARMPNRKAPGADGIPSEFFKTAVQSTSDEAYDGVNPPSALGRMLLRMANRVLRTGQLPQQWQRALVVSIPKKGDLRQMDNYRGISLIPVVLKLVTTLAIRRVQKGLEQRQWFRREQAGFRFREECPAHAVALYEIVQRRRAMGHGTYLAFVDMRKAYDTVPHGALLHKLWAAGVRGQVLRFFRALYDGAQMAVVTPYGCSEAVPVLRGVRQGCPASPTIFNVFVNDILEACDAQGLGVSVPGLRARVSGLLFADDLVIMAPSRARLERMLQSLDGWAQRNEMEFGIAKCGVMGVGFPRYQARLRREPHRWQLGGEAIPVVESYTYLGLLLQADLDLNAMAAARADKGWSVLHTLRPVLSCSSIPLAMRLRMVKYILVPSLAYGAELWGMSDARCTAVSRVLSTALRLLIRVGERSTLVSPLVVGLETDVCPMAARAAGSRARAFYKFPSLRTTVAALLCNLGLPARSMRSSWEHWTRLWLARYGPPAAADAVAHQEGEAEAADAAVVGAVVAQQRMRLRTAVRHVREHVWLRLLMRTQAASVSRYLERDLWASNGYIHAAVQFPLDAVGVHWLTRARVGAIWTATAYARIHWLPAANLAECPFCLSAQHPQGETLTHMLVECPRWHEPRAALQPLLEEARGALGAGVCSESLAVFLLGGRARGDRGISARCSHWVKLPRKPQNGVQGVDQLPGFVLVARFFAAVMPARLAVLGPLLHPPRADALMGMAAFAEGGNVPT